MKVLKLIWFPCFNEFIYAKRKNVSKKYDKQRLGYVMLPKNRNKRKYFQNNFAQFEKNRVKRKWLENMNQLKKTYFVF